MHYAFINDQTPTSYSGSTRFSSLTYTASGGLAPYIESITVDPNGNVHINRRVGPTGGTNSLGVLTAAESQWLNTAFVNANPAELPATITDPASEGLTGIPSEILSSIIGSASHVSVVERAGFYGGSSTLKSLVDAIRGPAERIVRGTLTQSFQGHVHYVGSTLKVGRSTSAPTDPFYNFIASAVGDTVAFDGLGRRKSSGVVDVHGTLDADRPLLSFPSAGADAVMTLPAGTQPHVTNLTLAGDYFEITADGQRGFVLASAVSIIR